VKRAKWQLVTLLAVLLAASLATRGLAAQQASGLPRVGFLYLGSSEQAGDAIHEGMRSLGWFEGSNISLENRFANNDPARLFVDAVDLAAAKVDVIVALRPSAHPGGPPSYFDNPYRRSHRRFGPSQKPRAAG
jgi:ABC-type sugar transport system substrate-binding protein